MKKNIILLTVICVLTGIAASSSFAQQAAAGKAKNDTDPTMINSDRLQLDLSKHQGVFIGNVQVSNPRFEITSKEVLVFFSESNKPERFVAKGDVNMKSSERTATARQAEYIVAEKRIILTGDPVVMQGPNRVTGSTITLYPDSDRMDVQGRTAVQLYP